MNARAHSAPTSKAPNQRAKILELLRVRREEGATNVELVAIGGLRAGARVFELRRMGFVINTVRETESRFRFVLKAEPGQSRLVEFPAPPAKVARPAQSKAKPRRAKLGQLPAQRDLHFG